MQTPPVTPGTLQFQLDSLLEANTPLFLHGSPGIGKSQIVHQSASSRRWPIRDIRLSQLDPVDLRGIPVPVDGRTVWMPPVFFPDPGEPEGILFLDELNSAPVSVQAAVYQLVLDRKVGEYTLPPGWRIVCAGNRTTDRGIVFRLPSPLANRMVHIVMEASYDDFKKWAIGESVHPWVLGFLGFRPDLLSTEPPTDRETNPAFATPRSWTMLSRILRGREKEIQKLHQVIFGSVGYGAGAEFLAYTRVFEQLPSVEAILAGESQEESPPDNPGSLYALIAALVERWDRSGKQADHLLDYGRKLPVEFGVLLVKDCALKSDTIAEAKGFDSWVEEFGELIL